jgi:hypothetical protein
MLSTLIFPVLLSEALAQSKELELPNFNLETELRLAKLEGFPVDFQDIRRRTQEIADEDNAAVSLQKVRISKDILIELDKLTYSNISIPENQSRARSLIDDHRDILFSISEATSKPGYFVDRNWEDGIFLIFPDFSNLMNIRRLLTKAIVVESDRGNHDQCLEYLQSIKQISAYVLNPDITSIIVHEEFYDTYIRNLIQLASRYPEELRYLKLLSHSIKNLPPNLRIEGFKCGLPAWLKLYDDLRNRDSIKSNSILVELLEIDLTKVEDGGQDPEFTLGKAALINAFRMAVKQAQYSDPASKYILAGAFANTLLLSSGNPNFAELYFTIFTYFLPLNDYASFIIPERRKILYSQTLESLTTLEFDSRKVSVLSERGESLEVIRSISDDMVTISLSLEQENEEDELSITFPVPKKATNSKT